jgi:hypothetical protein
LARNCTDQARATGAGSVVIVVVIAVIIIVIVVIIIVIIVSIVVVAVIVVAPIVVIPAASSASRAAGTVLVAPLVPGRIGLPPHDVAELPYRVVELLRRRQVAPALGAAGPLRQQDHDVRDAVLLGERDGRSRPLRSARRRREGRGADRGEAQPESQQDDPDRPHVIHDFPGPASRAALNPFI